MNKHLLNLFELANKEGISIGYYDLPSTLLGLYMCNPKMETVIAIDKSIENNEDKLIEVLAEELGHHFTTTGDFTGHCCHYKDRLLLNKIEEKAVRWGTDFLIPLKDFTKVLKSGISSISDICEKLELPEPVVNMRLKFLSRQHESIKIDKTHSLILTCYPRIFIYEDMQY